MNSQTFEPGYFQKEPEPFSSIGLRAFPPAVHCWEDPGDGFKRVDVVSHAVWSNYTIMEYGDYTKLMYTAPGACSVEIHSWPAQWTINLDEILHWVFEHAKELNQ